MELHKNEKPRDSRHGAVSQLERQLAEVPTSKKKSNRQLRPCQTEKKCDEAQLVGLEISVLAAISSLIQVRNGVIETIGALQALLKDLRPL